MIKAVLYVGLKNFIKFISQVYSIKDVEKIYFFGIKNYSFLLVILAYGLVMSLLSLTGANNPDEVFKSLIIIPITGQMLHFYLDAYLWKFSVKHNRGVTLKHMYT